MIRFTNQFRLERRHGPLRSTILLITALLLSTGLRAQVPEVLYLKFNEGGSATTTADDSLVGLTGLSPTPTTGPLVWAAGKLGAHSFWKTSQSDAYWTLGVPIQVSGDWTIEFWCQLTQTGGNAFFFWENSTGGFLFSSGSPLIDADDMRLTGTFGEVVLNKAVPLNTWKHIAIVNDTAEGTMTPYVDGVAGTPWLPTGSTDIVGASGAQSVVGSLFWRGKVDELRVWNRARTKAEIQAFMNTELAAFTSDLTVSAIRSPVFLPHATQILGATETVTCEIMNVGTTTIPAGTSLQIEVTVNGQNPAIEMLMLGQALAPGDQLLHTCAATADLSATGPQTLQVKATMTGDLNPGNDLRERDYGGSYGFLVNQLPWSEDFEAMPAPGDRLRFSFWGQEAEAGSGISAGQDWTFGTQNLSWLSPGNSGNSAFARGFSNAPIISMRSPLLDLRAVNSPRLRMRFISDRWSDTSASGTGNLSLDIISQPGDLISPDFFGPVGDLGPGWKEIQIDLSAFAGQVIQVRPRVTAPLSPLVGHFIFIDDLLLTDHQVGLGQAPQPGLAVFDLNSSMNIGMNVPAYGEAGPYFTEAQAGDPMLFSFEGAPLQPILLVAGPLNPVAATFPNIGQLDLGGPVDPMTGIPIGIFILFDGNQPGPLNSFFLTDALGHSSFGFTLPAFPPGPLATFQAVLRDPTTGLFVIGNAIELRVN